MVDIKKIGYWPATNTEIRAHSEHGVVTWYIPEETPVAFVFNQRNYAVMMATPENLDDFAIGFSMTERIVNAIDEIFEIEIRSSASGIEFHLRIAQERLDRLDIRQQRRNLVGRAGCGICGLENADTFFETLPRVSDQRLILRSEILQMALTSLADSQPLNNKTRSVHAAAWAGVDGKIKLVREDVGRHNALDKLLGSLVHASADLSDGFVLMSSRCSYEIIEKAARLGVRAVASISGPTAFALRKAQEANMSIYCRSEAGFIDVSGTDNVSGCSQ